MTFLLAYLNFNFNFNIFVYGSWICIFLMNTFGNRSILREIFGHKFFCVKYWALAFQKSLLNNIKLLNVQRFFYNEFYNEFYNSTIFAKDVDVTVWIVNHALHQAFLSSVIRCHKCSCHHYRQTARKRSRGQKLRDVENPKMRNSSARLAISSSTTVGKRAFSVAGPQV